MSYSEHQAYYEEFRRGFWSDPDPKKCRCHGSGWAVSEVDTVHECPVHYRGQLHPEEDVPEGVSYEDANAESMARYAAAKAAKRAAKAAPPAFVPPTYSPSEDEIPF